jgi:hypothetical protein
MLLFSVCWLQMENEIDKLLFVFCKWKTELCFPWSANDNHSSTFAVLTDVPIYGLVIVLKKILSEW